MKTLSIVTGLTLAAGAAVADTPVLTVYTYDSFMSDWGPGPAVERGFEAECGCDLHFIGAGDGAEMLSRLRLEGARTRADAVLGLDTGLIHAARETGLFAPHGLTGLVFDLPIDWADDMFVPFDWGYFAFVYDKTQITDPPASFEALAGSDFSIVIQDPRSSTPGLGLLLWIKSAYGDRSGAIWQGLSDNIITVTKGWTESYGMFLEGEADMVLSYSTSPAYHLIAEDDATKAAARFDEGHYLQIEVGAVLATSDQPYLARRFLAYVVSDAVQTVIPTTNWMYPAVMPTTGLPDGFESLIQPGAALLFNDAEAQDIRDEALEEWRAVLSQ